MAYSERGTVAEVRGSSATRIVTVSFYDHYPVYLDLSKSSEFIPATLQGEIEFEINELGYMTNFRPARDEREGGCGDDCPCFQRGQDDVLDNLQDSLSGFYQERGDR